ncbi:MAG: N-acetylmuramoyl-L-alanine amidase [Rikenellaceae bacterium]|nr:N-acetylmuramoyl-L-alanine amidase [Rikenellaceae bacterium]
MITIKKGSRGDDVKLLQRLLNLTPDGIFGSQTEMMVKIWQKDNRLVADGIVGAKSWKRLIDIFSISPVVTYDPLVVHISQLRNRTIKYIAVHYTAGIKSSPGSAKAVKSVFNTRNASADFAVDDRDIIQFNPDIRNNYTWAVGDPKNTSSGGASLYGICTNRNSVSVEICSTLLNGWSARYPNHEGWVVTDKTVENARRIVKILIQVYNIPIQNVVRHYDVTGKLCPGIVGWNQATIYTNTGKATPNKSNDHFWLQFKMSL